MIIKALKDFNIRHRKGRGVIKWEYYSVDEKIGIRCSRAYRWAVEVMPCYVEFIKDNVYKGKSYKAWDIIEVSPRSYIMMKKKGTHFDCFDTVEEYLSLLDSGKLEKTTEEVVEAEEVKPKKKATKKKKVETDSEK